SVNESFRFSFIFERNLFEVSKQSLEGLQTNIEIDKFGRRKLIARPDMKFADLRVRWMKGLPILGGESLDSLTSFYRDFEMKPKTDLSADLLFTGEIVQQKISGSSPFIPKEREA